MVRGFIFSLWITSGSSSCGVCGNGFCGCGPVVASSSVSAHIRRQTVQELFNSVSQWRLITCSLPYTIDMPLFLPQTWAFFYAEQCLKRSRYEVIIGQKAALCTYEQIGSHNTNIYSCMHGEGWSRVAGPMWESFFSNKSDLLAWKTQRQTMSLLVHVIRTFSSPKQNYKQPWN